MHPQIAASKAEARVRLQEISRRASQGDYSWSYDEYIRLQEEVSGPIRFRPLSLRAEEGDRRRAGRRAR